MNLHVVSPFTVAMAQPQPNQSLWVSLMPIALMIAIFYLIVLMPMRKRQKKIQDFQNSLKVGDRVITTSGIYGEITKIDDRSIQIQIADKVRINVARVAIGGLQGEEPVVPAGNSGF